MGTHRLQLVGPALAVALAVSLAACGAPGRAASVPTFPASALPDLHSRSRPLTSQTLAGDAPGLAAEQEHDGFLAGSERTFSARVGEVRYVEARVLRFDSPEGAAGYVAWVEGHGDLLLGAARELPPLALDGSPAFFFHEPSGCCTKDTPLYLAVWRRGDTVLTLLVGGPQEGRDIATRLAGRLDALVSGSRDAAASA